MKVGSFSYRNIKSRMDYEDKCLIANSIRSFCLSAHTSFVDYAESIELSSNISELCISYLSQMQDGTIDCTHDFYLKLFHLQLANGSITFDNFDLLMIDEAGDLNEVTFAIFNLLPATRKLMVGDTCMPGSQRIKTSTGWRRLGSIIRDLEIGKSVDVWSYNHDTDEFEYRPASNPSRTGAKQCYKVKTTRSQIECTANHKVLTDDGYKRTDELIVGDIILKDGESNLKNVKRQLNSDQFQVVLGSWLGDGHLQQFSDKECRLALGHSVKQINYLNWKASAFDVEDSIKLSKSRETTYGPTVSYSVRTKAFVTDNQITIDDMYKMDALALAIWVMDDGSVRNRLQENYRQLSITIDSNAFSYEDNSLLVDVLDRNFGLEATIQKTRSYYRLSFNKVNSLKLLDIISQYINDDFIGKFKFGPSKVVELDSSTMSYTLDVVTSITPTRIAETYDMTVAGNHNFIASSTAQKPSACGIIVHNCQNIYTFNHTVNCFDLVRDSATFFPMTQSFRVSQSIASRIESFGIKYLSPDFKFVGVPDQPNPDIVTRAFISCTNAGLIAKMIELNVMGVPYGLVRDPKAIFELPLLLMSLKPRGFIGKNEFKFLQTDYDDWTKSPTLRDQYKSPLSFIGSQHPDDVQLQTAIRLLGTHGASEIMSCYNEAKHHRKSNQSYQLGTAFVFKGLEVDEVIIADDLNQSMAKVANLLTDGFEMTPDMTTICNLAYVAASRARHQLTNCNYL